MINLLNPGSISDIKSARFNVRLRRYMILIALIGLGIIGIYGAGFWFAHQEYAVANERHEKSEQELQHYAAVQKKIIDYRANLKIADKILNSGVVFSQFLTDTGNVMPANTILSNLTISTQTPSASQKPGSLVLEARTKSYDDALKLKESLTSSSLFSDVRIISVNVPEKRAASGIESVYPYQARYDVVINQLAGISR